ncbi:MAG TPA: hypothetical protein VGD42_07410 [Lysobacter sp.]
MEPILPAVLRCLATIVLSAWVAFVLLRSQRALVARGRGWRWVALAGLLGLAPWTLHGWLGGSIACPLVAASLYLLSLVGLAPDDSVLDAQATVPSRWFQRALVSAALANAAGMAAWAMRP